MHQIIICGSKSVHLIINVIFLLKKIQNNLFLLQLKNIQMWKENAHYKWYILQSYVFFDRSECFHISIQDLRCKFTDKMNFIFSWL